MKLEPKNRQYLTFDPSKGYPANKDLYYECLKCGDVIPSIPKTETDCKCRNIMIDVGFSRMDIQDPAKVRLFRLIH
jgi:hypothetical protein